ncbi:MAG: response regulator transcription factor [Chloroflexi bacterium]|nr:response regulator transcription factor [Chloroflexota bacterium]
MSTTILLIDDDAVVRESEAFGLRRAGYDVVTAGSILEAMRRLNGGHFDLVLVDLTLPDGDGITLSRSLRTAGITFVFVTGHSAEETIARGLEAGAADYLIKPVGLDELIGRVGAVLRRANESENDYDHTT